MEIEKQLNAINIVLTSFTDFRKNPEKRVAYLESLLEEDEPPQYLRLYFNFPVESAIKERERLLAERKELGSGTSPSSANPLTTSSGEYDYVPITPVTSEVDFNGHQLGTVVVDRSNKVKGYCDEILQSKSKSFYFRGPAGSGKTTFMYKMIEEMASRNNPKYDILVIKYASDLDLKLTESNFREYFQNRTNTAIIFIDEANSMNNINNLKKLTRGQWNMKVVIFGIPSLESASPETDVKYPSSALLLNDEEVKSLQLAWQRALLVRNATMQPNKVSDICKFVWEFTGGLIFPTLMILDHCFIHDNNNFVTHHLNDFEVYLKSAEFNASDHNKRITARCYGLVRNLESDFTTILKCADNNPKSVTDAINNLMRFGYWDETTRWFTSDHLLSHVCNMSRSSQHHEEEEEIKSLALNHTQMIEMLICSGLKGMCASDFLEIDINQARMENAMGFRWAMKIQQLVPWVFMSPQTRALDGGSRGSRAGGSSPTVDFTFNGAIDVAIELSKNSYDLRGKLVKIGKDGVYKQWCGRSAILNFQMKQSKKLADDPRIYHYVHDQNVLYRGNEVIIAPAVDALPCPSLAQKKRNVINKSTSQLLQQFLIKSKSRIGVSGEEDITEEGGDTVTEASVDFHDKSEERQLQVALKRSREEAMKKITTEDMPEENRPEEEVAKLRKKKKPPAAIAPESANESAEFDAIVNAMFEHPSSQQLATEEGKQQDTTTIVEEMKPEEIGGTKYGKYILRFRPQKEE